MNPLSVETPVIIWACTEIVLRLIVGILLATRDEVKSCVKVEGAGA